MRRSTGLLLGLIWLAVVVVVSGVTWMVIDTAGSQVLRAEQPVLPPGTGGTTSPTAGAGHRPRGAHGGSRHPHRSSSTATAPAQPAPSTNSSTTPSQSIPEG